MSVSLCSVVVATTRGTRDPRVGQARGKGQGSEQLLLKFLGAAFVGRRQESRNGKGGTPAPPPAWVTLIPAGAPVPARTSRGGARGRRPRARGPSTREEQAAAAPGQPRGDPTTRLPAARPEGPWLRLPRSAGVPGSGGPGGERRRPDIRGLPPRRPAGLGARRPRRGAGDSARGPCRAGLVGAAGTSRPGGALQARPAGRAGRGGRRSPGCSSRGSRRRTPPPAAVPAAAASGPRNQQPLQNGAAEGRAGGGEPPSRPPPRRPGPTSSPPLPPARPPAPPGRGRPRTPSPPPGIPGLAPLPPRAGPPSARPRGPLLPLRCRDAAPGPASPHTCSRGPTWHAGRPPGVSPPGAPPHPALGRRAETLAGQRRGIGLSGSGVLRRWHLFCTFSAGFCFFFPSWRGAPRDVTGS